MLLNGSSLVIRCQNHLLLSPFSPLKISMHESGRNTPVVCSHINSAKYLFHEDTRLPAIILLAEVLMMVLSILQSTA